MKSISLENIEIGRVIRLDSHRIICGDSTDQRTVDKLLSSIKIDCWINDEPYGIGAVESKQELLGYSSHQVIQNDQLQSEAEHKAFIKSWIQPVLPYLNKKNSIYFFNSDKMVFVLREAMQECGLKFSQLIVWVKSQPVIGRLDYLPQHELIAYGWYGTHKFRHSKDKSVLFYPKPSKSKLHPTMKPVALLRNLILNSTETGDIVLDNFLGSGSTLIACEHTGRKCYGIELDPGYVATTIKRWQKLTGKRAEYEDDSE
jgi:site-specific DNA-methyltransferase (adenine-specific)